MPKLPTKETLGVAIPRPSPMVSMPDMSAQYRGLIAVGGAIAGEGAEEKQKRDALDLIKAEAEQRKGLYEIKRAFETDTDYATYDPRFQEYAKGLTERTAGMIRDPHTRELWIARANNQNEVARDSILRQGIALKKETQFADLGYKLDDHLGIIADPQSTPQDRSGAERAIDESLKLALRSGLIDPLKERRMRLKYGQDAEMALIRNRLQSGENPASLLKDLDGVTGPHDPRVISHILETGKDNWRLGLKQIEKDKSGTASFGNFGLNTGGSMQKFVKEYGGKFGLTADPTSEEFKKQWTNAANSAPVELHKAEMEWYKANIASKVSDRLMAVGVPEELAMDSRVQTYFNDRMVHQGPWSIKNHASRISSALAQSGSDPESFLRAMTQLDEENVTGDFKTILSEIENEKKKERFIQGLKNRAIRREELSVAGDDGYKGPYKYLTVQQRRSMANEIRRANHSTVLQDLADSEARIKQTGVIPVDANDHTALDRASTFLTPNQFKREQFKWEAAKKEYAAISPLKDMTDSQIADHLDALRPDTALPDEHYATLAKIQDKAEREWDRIVRERQKDPALSVSKSPEVVDTVEKIRALGPSVPTSVGYEYIIAARKQAQSRLGIPDNLQRIVTQREADALLHLPRNPTVEDVETSFREASQKAVSIYGKYAEEALRSAKDLKLRSENARLEADSIIEENFGGAPAAPKEGWFDSIYNMIFGAEEKKPEAPKPKVPNQAQIDWVLSDPDKRRMAFDQEFGAGAFARLVLERTKEAAQ